MILIFDYEFNLQAVGYSRSSLPRGTQYNTQAKQITIRPEPILLFFHLFFFPAILFFLPILLNILLII